MRKPATKLISVILIQTFCLTQISYAAPVMQNLRENQPTQTANTPKTLAAALGRSAGATSQTVASAAGNEVPVTSEERKIVIEMLSRFDTGLTGITESWTVTRNTSGRIHTPPRGTYIIRDTFGKTVIGQNIAPTFDRPNVDQNIRSMLDREDKAEELGLYRKGANGEKDGPLADWEKIVYYPINGSNRIHLDVVTETGRHDVWRFMGNIDGTIYQQFASIGKDMGLSEETIASYRKKAARLLGQAMVKFEIVGAMQPDDPELQVLKRPLEDYHNRERYVRDFIALLKGETHRVSPGTRGLTPLVKMVEGIRTGEYGPRVNRMIEIFLIVMGFRNIPELKDLTLDQLIEKLKSMDTDLLIETLKEKSLFLSLSNQARAWQHRDPKLNNWIFEVDPKTGEPLRVKAAIDLDTIDDEDIWTTDKGDLGRSICLLTGEGDDLWKKGLPISATIVDPALGDELIKGYIDEMKRVRTEYPELLNSLPSYFSMDFRQMEKLLLTDICNFLTELGFRFFMDFPTEFVEANPNEGGITEVRRHNPYFRLAQELEAENPHYESIEHEDGTIAVEYRPGFTRDLCLGEVEIWGLEYYLLAKKSQLELDRYGITPETMPRPIGWGERLAYAAAAGASAADSTGTIRKPIVPFSEAKTDALELKGRLQEVLDKVRTGNSLSPQAQAIVDWIRRTYSEESPEFITMQIRRRLEIVTRFIELYGEGPIAFVRAPGRFNLIGEHTDNQDGYVLPVAIDKDILIAYRPTDDSLVELHNMDGSFYDANGQPNHHLTPFNPNEIPHVIKEEFGGEVAKAPATLPLGPYGEEVAIYGRAFTYFMGVAHGLRRLVGDANIRGAKILQDGRIEYGGIPQKAGLSSSSATTVGAALVFGSTNNDLGRVSNIGPVQLAELTSLWERFQTAGGMMDQFASLNGGEEKAIFLDCRKNPNSSNPEQAFNFRKVPLPPNYRIVLMNTKVESGQVDSEYNERRTCVEIGTRWLQWLMKSRYPEIAGKMQRIRDLTPENLGISEAEILALLRELPEESTKDQILGTDYGKSDKDFLDAIFRERETQLPYKIRKRCIYQLAENKRVLTAVAALERNDSAGFAQAVNEGQTNNQDGGAQFGLENSYTELDLITRLARENGALCSRLSGKGWGGVAFAILPPNIDPDTFIDTIISQYETGTEKHIKLQKDSDICVCGTSEGASVENYAVANAAAAATGLPITQIKSRYNRDLAYAVIIGKNSDIINKLKKQLGPNFDNVAVVEEKKQIQPVLDKWGADSKEDFVLLINLNSQTITCNLPGIAEMPLETAATAADIYRKTEEYLRQNV